MDTVEDEVVEVEAAIVEHVLSKIVLARIVVCTNTIKKTKQSLNLQVHSEASGLKKKREVKGEERERENERFLEEISL